MKWKSEIRRLESEGRALTSATSIEIKYQNDECHPSLPETRMVPEPVRDHVQCPDTFCTSERSNSPERDSGAAGPSHNQLQG